MEWSAHLPLVGGGGVSMGPPEIGASQKLFCILQFRKANFKNIVKIPFIGILTEGDISSFSTS